MRNRSKWIEQVRPSDNVARAARVTLKSRLPPVVHFLHLAAHHADKTPEHVHQLRVSTRRTLAALSLYRCCLDVKHARWFQKWLRRTRRAAGDARDLDVFLQRYDNDGNRVQAGFLRDLKKRRRKAQRPIRRLAAEMIESGRFERRVKKLKQSITTQAGGTASMDAWGRRQLAGVTESFFEKVPTEPYDLERIHQFRVQGKKLRYTLELLAALFPEALRTHVYPLVSELQERLGTLNDHATACRRLNEWIVSSRDPASVDYMKRLVIREQRELERSVAEFATWWTPEFSFDLKTRLDDLTLMDAFGSAV